MNFTFSNPQWVIEMQYKLALSRFSSLHESCSIWYRQRIIAAIAIVLFSVASAQAAAQETAEEIADFWYTVFKGPAPYGVPAVNGARFNRRTVKDTTVWDVRFDSYRDPADDNPVRLSGVLAIPDNIRAPGPGGTFPGIAVTHSVGVRYPKPDDVVEMATFFARKGYVALAFYMRGWGTSRTINTRTNNSQLFTAGLAGDGQMPFDNDFAGMAVDCYQAGEFLAMQSEVWDSKKLAFIGHSGGGYCALMAGIFSSRFDVIVASAPANSSPDPRAWLDYWFLANRSRTSKGISKWIKRQPNPDKAKSQIVRTLSFTGAFAAIDNPRLAARDSDWRLDNTAIWFYGGDADQGVPAADVQQMFDAADPSDATLKAFHWSPTGAHGGAESWRRAQAWLAGHYPGVSTRAPKAVLTAVSVSGTTVSFSATGSTAVAYGWAPGAGAMSSNPYDIVSWEYDFGDGERQNWGPKIDHTYATPGTYDVTLTITDGAGNRNKTTIQTTVGG